MTIDEAKTLYKQKYAEVGLILEDEHLNALYFSRGQSKWIADAEDFTDYVTQEALFSDFEAKPSECSICSKSYREQALVDIDIFPAPVMGAGQTELVFGDAQSGQPYAVFARSSPLFRAYFRFAPGFLEWSSRRIRDSSVTRRRESRLVDRLIVVPVIRVEHIGAASIDEAVKISDGIITGCLFQLASLKGLAHRPQTKWPQLRSSSQVQPRPEEDHAPIPLLRVNPIRDLVSLYTLGASTHYAQFEFLAYYQVLEYFFVKIADERLYEKLTRRLNDLTFRCLPAHLDRLIQDVSDHRRETDEVAMLKGVLEKYIDESELVAFLTEYEQRTATNRYSKKRALFGTDVQVSFTLGHVFGGVAKTTKTIRNALVHSSDRYERAERYVPFSGSEEVIAAEIPLMKFLAEKIIIASASPVT